MCLYHQTNSSRTADICLLSLNTWNPVSKSSTEDFATLKLTFQLHNPGYMSLGKLISLNLSFITLKMRYE